MNSNIYIHVIKGSENVIYNAIKDPTTGNYYYPDILFKHNFIEKEICDNKLYETASKAIKEYGSSRCCFVMYKDYDAFVDLLECFNHIFTNDENILDMDAVDDFGNMLQLSATMMNSLKILLNYYAVLGNDVKEFINSCVTEYELPVSTKIKGKQIYELIRQKIIG